MTQPIKKEPVLVELEAGKTYWWCRCGLSQNQPWCDGSHAGTDMEPMEYTAKRARNMRLCACKASKRPPYCDGSHMNL